mmetsp:Transcript_23233/g.49686  ORF Transcript_23233/g.49686 Transcript_23233/m.49686 type:complete len:241 (-) Transcript_23233:23-745(-)
MGTTGRVIHQCGSCCSIHCSSIENTNRLGSVGDGSALQPNNNNFFVRVFSYFQSISIFIKKVIYVFPIHFEEGCRDAEINQRDRLLRHIVVVTRLEQRLFGGLPSSEQRTEQIFHEPRNEPIGVAQVAAAVGRKVVPVRFAPHRVRFSRPSLAVREHGGIVPVQKRIQQRRGHVRVEVTLRHIGVEDGVVGELAFRQRDGAVERVAVHDGVAALGGFLGRQGAYPHADANLGGVVWIHCH